MATLLGQPSANLANMASNGPERVSSNNGPATSESPNVPVPSPSPVGAVPNGDANGHPPSSASPPFASYHPVYTGLKLYPRGDGRIRNPVPSKLKDVNDHMRGSFNVMHMDVVSHRASEGRDAAAKRTSENTELQAKLAQTNTYVSHQRRAHYPRPPASKQSGSKARAESEAAVNPGPCLPLTVEETKSEQARLLTLLRALPHHTVVDQICKALAFFGGIPDAPPPTDGKFPESAWANGSGSLFVGWISEIFPDLDNPRKPPPAPPAPKRPRGRPKGSKASKIRSDKGIKKGPMKATKTKRKQTQDANDDGWVDVDDSVLELNDDGDLIEASGPSQNPSTPSRALNGGPAAATPATGSTAGFRSINNSTTTPVPGSTAKRRGRPKGSKNRPKPAPNLQQATQPGEAVSADPSQPVQNAGGPSTAPPPKVTPVPVPVPMLDVQSRKNADKPKAARKRSKAATTAAKETPQASQSSVPAPSNHQNSNLSAAAPTQPDGIPSSTDHGAAAQDTGQLPAGTQPGSQQAKQASVTARKRKRPSANTSAPAPEPDGTATATTNESYTQHPRPDITQPISTSELQSQGQLSQQASMSSTPVPAPKRARKSQDPNATSTARRSTPNNTVAKNPPTSSAISAEATLQPSPATLTAVPNPPAPPAEGLEAHYVAMQNRNEQLANFNIRAQAQKQQQPTASLGVTASPASNPNPAPAEGLEAHYERMAALQNIPDKARQPTVSRQQKQPQITQTASPVASQSSKTTQMSGTMAPQPQPRPSQNFYSQAQTLGSSYSTQQPSYPANQRQQQHMGSGSPVTGLVQHVNNSPQFSAQSNSPLMQAENTYRGSPSLMHGNAAFAPRRTPTASPLDSNPYRPGSTTSHGGVTGHSPQYGTRQTPTTTTHTTSHSTGMPTSFSAFPDPSFLELQGLDSTSAHGGLNLGAAGSYGLGTGGVPQHSQHQQQQRSSSSGAASLYTPPGLGSSYLGASGLGRANQNRWPS
ncbi:hypothetical protein F4780DRAFT_330613 [Xylariomycetidae sp. FL0641]|nr:hypothetical protein F4780DRAFT_330613 [Xylariomycetidae sp. FL0641]